MSGSLKIDKTQDKKGFFRGMKKAYEKFIDKETLKMAEIAHYLVNSELVQKFLKSIIFSGSKRAINKDTLMRIDFARAFESTDFEQASKEIKDLEFAHWKNFNEMIKEEVTEQMTLF